MIAEIVTAVALPIPFQRMVDTLTKALKTGHHNLGPHAGRLAVLASAYLLIAALDGVFTYLDSRNTARVAQLSVTDLRRALFDHLQRLSLSFHHDKNTRLGELQTRLSTDVSSLQDLVAGQLSVIVTSAGTALIM